MPAGEHNAVKTHCPKGHEYTEANTQRIGKYGSRFCRQCKPIRKRDDDLRTRYGMTVDQRDAMLAAQGGGCKLCRRTDCHWGKGFQNVWHIDHVHGTKIVRGILCASCNMLVGQIEKDLMLSREVIKYLGVTNGTVATGACSGASERSMVATSA